MPREDGPLNAPPEPASHATAGKYGNLFLPFFAAGYAIPADTLSTGLVQAFFDNSAVRFSEELLSPSPDKASRLIFEPVPRRYHQRPFSELFIDYLTRYGVLVMGLYRCRSALKAPLHYVVTGPPPETLLFSDETDEDCCYILSPYPTSSFMEDAEAAERGGEGRTPLASANSRQGKAGFVLSTAPPDANAAERASAQVGATDLAASESKAVTALGNDAV